MHSFSPKDNCDATSASAVHSWLHMGKAANFGSRQQANVEASTRLQTQSADHGCSTEPPSRETGDAGPRPSGPSIHPSNSEAPKTDQQGWLTWWALPIALLLLSISLQTAILMGVKLQSYPWVTHMRAGNPQSNTGRNLFIFSVLMLLSQGTAASCSFLQPSTIPSVMCYPYT